MSFLEEIREAKRRIDANDGWYFTDQPYVLELRSVAGVSGLPADSVFMILPLGPENYKVSRVFRQSVTPTLGGIVAEERGLLWCILTVSGTFGLKPKFSVDTSIVPDPTFIAPAGGKLSGPAWTRRMLRNYFDKYGMLKADPVTASETELVWHDTKTGDSWVVVPETVDLDRDSGRRAQYPWSFQLKTLGRDEQRVPKPSRSDLSAIGKAAQAIAEVNKGLALVNSAIQEGSAFLGEVRFYVASIDSVVDKLSTIADSASSFVDGVEDTISVGASFISSTAGALQSTLDLMETVDELPTAIRQNYQMALDGLHQIGAQQAAFGQSYTEATQPIANAEAGASRGATTVAEDGSQTQLEALESQGPSTSVSEFERSEGRSSDQSLVNSGALDAGRTFSNYSGFRDYVIKSVDTLASIAAKLLGDGSLWYDLAIVNDLKPPYLSASKLPGTVWVGDTIAVPVTDPGSVNAVVAGQGSDPGEELLGVDIALKETSASQPGRPSVDIAWDERTLRDVKLIRGFDNLAQALQMRLWTERGSLPLSPGYGIRRTIGLKSTAAFLTLLRINYEQTMRQDSRVRGIGRIQFEPAGDLIEVQLDVIPKGASTSRAVSTSIV